MSDKGGSVLAILRPIAQIIEYYPRGGHISVGTVALAFQAAEQARSGFSSLFRNLGLFYEHTIFAGILFP